MEALVKISEKKNPITTSVKIAEVFGKRHDNVLSDIRRLSCSEDFQLLNFKEMFITKQLPNGGQRNDPYYVMTKDGFSFLVMGYTGEKAAQFKEMYIREFNKYEAMLKSDEYILARAQEISQQKMKMLEESVAKQQTLIEEQAPKVHFAESVEMSPDCILVRDLAAYLTQKGFKIGQNQLFKRLQVDGYLCSAVGDRYNTPTGRAMKMGLFAVKPYTNQESGRNVRHKTVYRVTGKGLIYFLDKYTNNIKTIEF
jgi:anti-repressor protein